MNIASNRIVLMYRILLMLSVPVIFTAPCLAADMGKRPSIQTYWEANGNGNGPALSVTASIEPCVLLSVVTRPAGRLGQVPGDMGLSVSPIDPVGGRTLVIRFQATAGPGLYDADREVVVRVRSNSASWTLTAEATPLVGKNGSIPREQVFVGSDYMDPKVDKGGGAGFEGLGSSVVVAKGSKTGMSDIPLKFKLKAVSKDRAGFYKGFICLSYLAAP